MTANEKDPATGTRSTRPEAPAEAASDAPTGNPSQPRPTLPEGMGELDRRAIDTVRVLAMDAVQKAGNGHPGTAMSVGPTAYLLFQKWLRHDPGDPDWAGRDRFVLSMGHSSLTLYIQLFLSGYGLELSDLEALRTWGSRTPGHPEVNHTPGVETTTGPLGQGVGNAVGMAMAARRERGLLDPDAPEGESVFDHTVWAFASDGDLEEGVSGEASSLAGTQELGNLVLVYDANRISIEDNTGIAFTEDVGTRYEAYGWHVQHVDDGEDLAAVDRALAAAQAETGRPSLIVLRTIIGWPSPNKQNTELFQLQNDQGPCLECFRTGQPVTATGLAGLAPRWPRFAQAATQAGFATVEALPMRLRGQVIGALNLFRAEPGSFETADVRIGQALADVATIGLLHERNVRRRETVAEQLQAALNSRVVIEQAKGKLAERLSIDMDRAFRMLRDYARNTNQHLTDVARTFVEGATADFPPPVPASRRDRDEGGAASQNRPGWPGPRAARSDGHRLHLPGVRRCKGQPAGYQIRAVQQRMAGLASRRQIRVTPDPELVTAALLEALR